jgi:glycerol-3-phosphate acyltransferase PlsY
MLVAVVGYLLGSFFFAHLIMGQIAPQEDATNGMGRTTEGGIS